MAADQILTSLIGFNLAIGAAIALAVLTRGLVRRQFGARVAYGLWLIAPLAGIASLLPAREAKSLLLEPAPLRPLAQAAVQQIDGVLTGAGQAQLALIAAWGVGALLALAVLILRQRASLALLGRLRQESPGLFRAANPAVGPAVVGVVRPLIILPADFEDRFDALEQTVILAHERAHLASQDVRINALVALARCILWFNPMIHLAAALIRIDQELACDEAVVARHPGERRAYAQALLKAQVKPAPLPLGCYWPARTRNRLKERLLMLTRKSPSRGRRLAGATAVGLAALGAGYAAWAAQPAASAAPAVLAQAAAPVAGVIQLAQNEAPAPQVHKRVIIKRDGQDAVTYEGDQIPADIQAQIDAAEATGQAHKVVKIIRHDGAGDVAIDPATQAQIDAALAAAGAGGDGVRKVMRIQCTKTDGGPANCTTTEGDSAETAALIEQLKSGEVPAGAHVIIRREQR